jgi:hypothetical protein
MQGWFVGYEYCFSALYFTMRRHILRNEDGEDVQPHIHASNKYDFDSDIIPGDDFFFAQKVGRFEMALWGLEFISSDSDPKALAT